jgi:hypothetical protein
MNRVKTMFSMESSFSSPSSTSIDSAFAENSVNSAADHTQEEEYRQDVKFYFQTEFENNSGEGFDFRRGELRNVMEPHLRRARLLRERSRNTGHWLVDASIASSIGVPYTALRKERPILFDEQSYPLHTILAQTLRVKDLTMVHEVNEEELLLPLLDRKRRHRFHAAYDNFVTSFCIPLLHSLAIANGVFHHLSSDRVNYRYQAFPSIHVLRPGSSVTAPSCDSSMGHSIGCLTFYIPLTPCDETNSLFVESHPGREDWHSLNAKSIGLGYLFDGARCIHFDLVNSGNKSRVALMFQILLYREGSPFDGTEAADNGLCPPSLLEDDFSREGPGYYEEAVIDLLRSLGTETIVKKRTTTLSDPDHRAGYPFL